MGNGLVLGFFDGVHIAHQKVISSAVNYATNPILVTLKNFSKSKELVLEREASFAKMKACGIKEIVELDFSTISSMQADDYLKFLIKEFHPISISTGFNYTFGKDKCGTTAFIADAQEIYGYKYFCVPPFRLDNEIISSTLIKKELEQGDICTSNKLLGSNFTISGSVKEGMQLGRKIGFPTANIDYPENLVKIPYGVYKVKFGNKLGVMNWGIKPTINIKQPILEIHIIDYSGNLYGKCLRIEILKRIRNEVKFNNLDELRQQIKKDIESCLKS